MSPFHLAFPVTDLQNTRKFYEELLGCGIGRTSDRWIDFDFLGNQISCHLVHEKNPVSGTNLVEGKTIPVPHFGVILPLDKFHSLQKKLEENNIEFIHKPMVRYKGKPGEQKTMFFKDPSGNTLELKSYTHIEEIFHPFT